MDEISSAESVSMQHAGICEGGNGAAVGCDVRSASSVHAVAKSASVDGRYQLRFASLFVEGRWLSFPCDAGGFVNLDALSERCKSNYLYARAMVGREYSYPSVVPEKAAG